MLAPKCIAIIIISESTDFNPSRKLTIIGKNEIIATIMILEKILGPNQTNNKGEIVKKLNANESGSIEMKIPLINSKYKNKNDLIFFVLLFTYLIIFLIFRKKTDARF